MQFLNPIFLFATLSISIPIALHFWHQKKGKVLNWAAMAWLSDKKLQPSKGLKFEQLLLLLLRCLLLFILTFWLSRLILNQFSTKNTSKIHLVQPSSKITESFRFELETALKNGEKVYWLNEKLEAAKDLNFQKNNEILNTTDLQKSLNLISEIIDNESVEIYFLNNNTLFFSQNIFVPTKYKLHFIQDSTLKKSNYLRLENQKKLGINKVGKLQINEVFDGNEVHKGNMNVLIKAKNLNEQKSISAAFEAIQAVYGLVFKIDLNEILNKKYDIIIGQIDDKMKTQNTLILETSSQKNPSAANLTSIENELSPQNSETVFAGQLPEIILNKIIYFYSLNPDNQLLTNKEVEAKFIERNDFRVKKENSTNQILLLLFIIVLIFERYIALKRNES